MKNHFLEKLETLMAASAFAQANDHDYALTLMGSAGRHTARKNSRKSRTNRPDARPQMRA